MNDGEGIDCCTMVAVYTTGLTGSSRGNHGGITRRTAGTRKIEHRPAASGLDQQLAAASLFVARHCAHPAELSQDLADFWLKDVLVDRRKL